eukprot:scaffold129060_cov51-Phaeocystis_antarctica.AAC.2
MEPPEQVPFMPMAPPVIPVLAWHVPTMLSGTATHCAAFTLPEQSSTVLVVGSKSEYMHCSRLPRATSDRTESIVRGWDCARSLPRDQATHESGGPIQSRFASFDETSLSKILQI